MKTTLKISMLALMCMIGTDAAFAAASVRTVGGTGTYSGSSSATAAKSSDASGVTSGASGTTAARAGSLRVTPSTTRATSGTATSTGSGNASTAGRSASMRVASPRLSLGKYLGGATSTSSSSSSSSSGSTKPGVSSEDLLALDDRIRALEDDMPNKQDALTAGDEYISIGDDGYIYLDVDSLKNELEDVVGREIELDTEEGYIVWRYVGDRDWNNLIALDELRGAPGEQGPRGEQGLPGAAFDYDEMVEWLSDADHHYPTVEEMNTAIQSAVSGVNATITSAISALESDIADTYQTLENMTSVSEIETDKDSNFKYPSVPATYAIAEAAAKAEAKAAADKAAGDVSSAVGMVLESYLQKDEAAETYVPLPEEDEIPSSGTYMWVVEDGEPGWAQVVFDVD